MKKETKYAKGGGVGSLVKEIEVVALSQSGTRGYKIYDTMTNRRAINTDGSYEFDDGEISEIIGEKNMDAFYDGKDKFKPKKKLKFDVFAQGGAVGSGDVVSWKGKSGDYTVVGVHEGRATIKKIGGLNDPNYKGSYNADIKDLSVIQKWATGGGVESSTYIYPIGGL